MRYLVLLIAICGVASAALLARAGLASGISPISLSAWRLSVASAALLGWNVFAKERPEWNGSDRILAGAAGLFLGLHFATWIASLNYVSVARSTLLVATSPLWAGVAGLFVPSLRPKPVFWAGLVVAGLGTWLVTTQGVLWHGGQKAWLGDVLALAGAMCFVPYLLISQRLQKTQGPLPTITWMYAGAAGSLWVIAAATGTSGVPNGWPVWGSVFGMAVFAQLIGHSGLNYSLKHFSAGQIAMSTLMEPVFAAALAWPLLHEPVTLLQGIGGLILLVGVGVALLR
jgi:drug/metabolite transporter (DMT)-like permease